ncbi:MAG TPA: sugar ABC transporter substrate-binding protein [Firmicutes bacterium]|nr:sugar ABC transporter substrate-binding protein [Bacillota bacterium]
MRKAARFGLFVMVLVMVLSSAVVAEKTKLVWATCCSQTERHTLFKELAKQYMDQHPDIEIEWIYPTGNYTNNIMTWIVAGTAPDVFWIGASVYSFYNLLMPLNDLVAKDPDIALINPMVLAQGAFAGRQICLPFGANAHTMFYNKDLLGTAGLGNPGWNWTFDDMVTMARRLQRDLNGDGEPDQYGIDFNTIEWSAILWGGNYYTDDGRKAQFANPVSIASTQLFVDLRNGVIPGYVPPTKRQANGSLTGQVAMRNVGIFDLPAHRQATFNWDIQRLPAFVYDGKEYRFTYNTIEGWSIPGNTKHPEEAKAFLAWLFSKEVRQQIAASRIVIPTQRDVVDRFINAPAPPSNWNAFIDALNWGNQLSLNHPDGTSIHNWMTSQKLWKDMWANAVPAAVALPEIQTGVNQLLDEFWARN